MRHVQPTAQGKREIVEVIQLVLVERVKGRVADQMVDIPAPPVMEEIMAVQEQEKLVPQGRVQQPTVEHAPVSQILAETVEVEVVLAPTERVQRGPVDLPMPHVLEETVEVAWSLVNECNGGLLGKLWMCLNCRKRPSRSSGEIVPWLTSKCFGKLLRFPCLRIVGHFRLGPPSSSHTRPICIFVAVGITETLYDGYFVSLLVSGNACGKAGEGPRESIVCAR